jgi:hypothetical protein
MPIDRGKDQIDLFTVLVGEFPKLAGGVTGG